MKAMQYMYILLLSSVLAINSAVAIEITSSDSEPKNEVIVDGMEPLNFISQYKEKINEYESNYGVYDERLGEQLLDLGLLYKGLEQYDEAYKALQRAMHINKVNHGLHSMDQIPILNNLISVDIASRSWDKLDSNYHQLLWVYRRNHEVDDPTLLPIIKTVGRWKITAYRNRLLSQNLLTTVKEAARMYDSIIERIETTKGENDPALIEPLYGQAMISYHRYQELAKKPTSDFHGVGSDTRVVTQCYVVYDSKGRPQRVCRSATVPDPNYHISQQRDKDMQMKRQMSAVNSNLKRIIEVNDVNPSLPDAERAEALVHLADYHLYNKNKATAIENYKNAYQLLATGEDNSEYLNRLFVKPSRIPSLSMSFPGPSSRANRATSISRITLALDITESGKTRNIELVEESDPENKKFRRRVMRSAKQSLYRPRFLEGEVLKTERVEVKFP